MTRNKTVFVEFNPLENKDSNELRYFVGRSLRDILEDTEDGTRFGGIRFESYKVVNRQFVWNFLMKYHKSGVHAVSTGRTKSYYIGHPIVIDNNTKINHDHKTRSTIDN